MSKLLDLFERDVNTDVLALTNIGKRISGNNEIMIKFTGNTEVVFTDCRFIYLPTKYKSEIKGAQGLVAHESGHIGYGSFEVEFIKLVNTLASKYKIPPFFTKNLVNVVEDVRVNAINKRKFPGFYRYLRILTKKMLPKLSSRIEQAKDILLYINLYLEDYKDFQAKPKIKDLEVSDKDWEGISKVKKFLFKSLTPSSSIISCDMLCKILKKYFTPEEMNQVKQINSLRGRNDATVNNIENISGHKKQGDKTKLDKISNELINKLKDVDLDPDDLETLINDVKENENENKEKRKRENTKGKQKKSKSKDSQNKSDNKDKMLKLKIITKLVKDAEDAMKERLMLLENKGYLINPFKGGKKRIVFDSKIERETMVSQGMSYAQIKAKYLNIIKKMKVIFANLKNKPGIDTYQKRGKLNSKYIKTITSNYIFRQCFTRKLLMKELKLLIMVDISSSMNKFKLQAAKIALVILCESLKGLAKIKIVLFTGTYDALNILVKDFDETLIPKKIDKFGRHSKEFENIDGLSIKHEAKKLEKGEIIIIISDGQPAAQGGYSLNDAIPDIHHVRKIFKVFAFSIDSQGPYLTKMYGNDWILTHPNKQTELGQKMIKFCQIITREFFR